jgi:GxxExxY protein
MLQKQNGCDQLTELIIGCGIKVHEQFGPGLFESVYSQCFAIELREAGLQIEVTPRIPLVYRGIKLEAIFQPDLVIEDTVVVEVKAVERLPLVYHAQVVTYLKLTGCPVGLLMNFSVSYLKDGIRRFVRPDLYRKRERHGGALDRCANSPSPTNEDAQPTSHRSTGEREKERN